MQLPGDQSRKRIVKYIFRCKFFGPVTGREREEVGREGGWYLVIVLLVGCFSIFPFSTAPPPAAAATVPAVPAATNQQFEKQPQLSL